MAGRAAVQAHAPVIRGNVSWCIVGCLTKLFSNFYKSFYCFAFYCFSEKINEVPNQLANFISKKQYLHATKLLVEAVSLGKGSLDGVESLKEISRELEQKKEVKHVKTR